MKITIEAPQGGGKSMLAREIARAKSTHKSLVFTIDGLAPITDASNTNNLLGGAPVSYFEEITRRLSAYEVVIIDNIKNAYELEIAKVHTCKVPEKTLIIFCVLTKSNP